MLKIQECKRASSLKWQWSLSVFSVGLACYELVIMMPGATLNAYMLELHGCVSVVCIQFGCLLMGVLGLGYWYWIAAFACILCGYIHVQTG